MTIGGMVWKTGPILDLYDQIAWFREQGLTGVAFHTAPALSGDWASFDVRAATEDDRLRLKAAVAGFAEVSVHAEFDNYDVILSSPNDLVRRASVESLRDSLDLAAYLGAPVVTVHEGASRAWAPPEMRREALARSIGDLAELAEQRGVDVAFELTRDYDLVLAAGGPVGVTLDVGHVSFDDGAGYRPFGTIGGLIRHLAARLVHVHVHDYEGVHDHLALGAGNLDFADIIGGLLDIGYAGMLCLELSPAHTVAEDYPRSAALLRALIAEHGHGEP